MKTALLSILFGVLAIQSLAQNKTVVFASNGKYFTQSQRDSIENTGNFVGITHTREVNDSIIYFMFYYDSTLLLTERQRRFQNSDLIHIRMKSIDGEVVDTERLKGRPIVLNFWSTSCGPCIAEIPQLNELQKRFLNNAYFIALAPETKQEIDSLLNRFPFNFTIIPDAGSVFESLSIDSYPVTFFINRNGIIDYVEEGIPVNLKEKPDGSLRENTGPFKILVYEKYSKILHKLTNKGSNTQN